ncbi:MAG: response regulator [Candidatus Omnitrophica bacterium]|nr:response regulator [Candidatus Omnitrophota bacterium]
MTLKDQNHKRILVVDDEPGMRDFLVYELQEEGYQASFACDGEDALEKIKNGNFQVVITDIKMPKMDGLELLEAAKKIYPYLEFIVVTGYARVENVVMAMKKGAYDLLQKPYELSEILVIVEKAFEKSQLRQDRDIALELSRAKSEFLATMSHEIRTPMNAVIGMTDLLEESPLSVEQREYVRILKNGGETLLNLINNILDLSKVESGNLELEKAWFNLEELCEQVMELVAYRAHAKGLELAFQILPEVPTKLMGDSNRLKQVLVNLIGNALKFTEKGEVVLEVTSAEKTEDQCRLLFSVKDTGIGIPNEKLKQIFDPFTQADASTTRKYGGTGLGLTISKKLAERMGGGIEVTSQLGQGTTFCVTLPFEIQKGGSIQETSSISSLKGLSVLLVDDNATNRLILNRILESWEAQVTQAASGEAAISELKRSIAANHPYQLLLLDCRMPNMDGFQLIEEIKKESHCERITILMLTSDARYGDIARAQKLGVSGYLLKPIRKMDLFNMITSTLAKREDKVQGPEFKETVPQNNFVQPLHILLAEDVQDNQILIQAYLKGTSWRLDFACDGREAVEKIQSDHYDIVLMDIQMPVMDGYAATHAVRNWEKEQGRDSVPIVALTARALKEEVQKSIDAGFTAYITKPIKKQRLLDVIQEQMQSREDGKKEISEHDYKFGAKNIG